MLKKYFTYEFTRTGHMLLPAFLIIVVTTFLVSGSSYIHIQTSKLYGTAASNFTFVMLTLLFTMVIAAASGISFMLLFLRFYRTMTEREAYLTHTLPLTTHTVLLAKTLTSFIWTLLIGLLALFSYMIFALLTSDSAQPIKAAFEMIQDIQESLENFPATTCLLFILMLLVRILLMIQHCFLATALGHLMSKQRALCTVAFYIGINCILSMIKNIFQTSALFVNPIRTVIPEQTDTLNVQLHWILAILGYLLLSILFYFITHYIFRQKLNLE